MRRIERAAVVGVEQRVGRVRVLVARLADAADVDQRRHVSLRSISASQRVGRAPGSSLKRITVSGMWLWPTKHTGRVISSSDGIRVGQAQDVVEELGTVQRAVRDLAVLERGHERQSLQPALVSALSTERVQRRPARA
jgi:hypothetical protein